MEGLPEWSIAPFVTLVLAMAVLPIVLPAAWERRWFQALVVAVCTAPVLALSVSRGREADIVHAATQYFAFIATLGALFVTSGGVLVLGDLDATPRTNLLFLVVGAVLASIIGTTGASMLLIRPLLRTNSQREHKAHLVPFFILTVANAGGLLTPLGDPPLLVGFIGGVPFLWTLKLLPVWALYVGSFLAAFYVVDRRAYAREPRAALARDRSERRALEVRGLLNVLLLGAIIGVLFLPPIVRELGMLAILVASYFATARTIHESNGFSFAPIAEVALLFLGLFLCLVPVEAALAATAPTLRLEQSWQLFWVSGGLSAVLDNAPTYAAFSALARGVSHDGPGLVAGIEPLKLAAVSAGSVVMGATTYIGNGPNLMIKAIAERAKYTLPGFFRYAVFAFVAMLPAHLVMTVAFIALER